MKCQPSSTSNLWGAPGRLSKKVFWTVLFSHFIYNWQAKSRETKLVRPNQFVVMLHFLVWLCRPMREWQSLLHKAHKELEEGKVELLLRRARFSSAFCRGFTSAFTIPSFTVRLQRSRSHAALQLFECFEVMFASVHDRLS